MGQQPGSGPRGQLKQQKPLKMKRGWDVGQTAMADLWQEESKDDGAKAGNILCLVNTAAAA